jgi:acyl-CoA thioesterase-1
MVELATKAGARVLLVGMRIPPNYGPKYTADFVQMYADLSAQYHAPLVPFLLQSVALDSSRMQDDGLHPNASGEPAVLDTLWPQLVPLLKKER